jgi:hypothetical protein
MQSQPAAVQTPFPCVVYTRDRAGGAYTFSHRCMSSARKLFPHSLRVSDLRTHDPQQNWAALRGACFLVLVAGDVAQCVSVASLHEKRIQFLFKGSVFSREACGADLLHTEFHEEYVPLHFFGSLAVFDARARFRSLVPIESSICLFPRRLTEADLPRLCKWVEASLLKCVHSSVWVTASGQAFNEHTLRPKRAATATGGGRAGE